MAYTTSQMSAFEDAVIALIATHVDVTDVQVAVGPLGDDSATEYIQSLGGPSLQDWASIGRGRKRENLTLTLEIRSEQAGGGEAVVKAVRDRVDVMVTAVEEALRDGVNVPDVGPIRRVQIDEISEPTRGTGSDRTSRAELRTVTITGLADLYVT